MRVLWLTKGLGRGGAERLLVNMLPHVDKERYEVDVAYLLPWKDAFVPEIEAHGAATHCLDAPRPYDPRWLWRLRRLVEASGFDVIHTHAPLPAAEARLAVPRHVGFVHTEHNLWSRYRVGTRWLNAVTYPRNGAVIAVSGRVAESIWVPARWSPPVEVVLHGTDLAAVRDGPEARKRARELIGLSGDVPIVATVGNFTAKKDHATLIAAFADLAGRFPAARLVLVGAGPLEEATRAEAERARIADRVLFLGSREDVLDLLPGFDVFTLSSRFEGFPIALVEAMASGVACVTTSVGGIPEIVADGDSGLLVEPGDPGQLATAIGKVLGDSELRSWLAASGKEAVAGLDLRHAVRAAERGYDRVADGSRSAKP